MTALVTGGTGLLGRAVLERIAASEQVVALCRPGTRPPAIAGVTWLEQDLAAPLRDDLPERVDAVLHVAQSRRHRDFPDGAVDTFAINAMATVRLLDYCRRAGGERFVYASSGAVYGAGAGARSEDDPLAPAGLYAASKLAGEQAAQSYGDWFGVSVLRPFFVYGPRQDAGAFLPGIAARVRERRPIDLHGPDGMRCNPIYVDEAAAAVIAARACSGNDVVNVAGPEETTLRRIGERLGELLDTAPVFARSADAGGDMVADTTRMRDVLVAPEIGVDAGLERLLTVASPSPS